MEKSNPKTIFYKNSFKEEHFKEIDIGRKFEISVAHLVVVRKKFKDLLPISVLKKNDLLKLCKDRVIPVDHHAFYTSLKTVATKPDFIDCSDEEIE